MPVLTCPECASPVESVVIDCRPTEASGIHAIRRRRQCLKGHRWNTLEIPQSLPTPPDEQEKDPYDLALTLLRKAYRLLNPGASIER